MKSIATPFVIAALMAMHAYAAESGEHAAAPMPLGGKRQLRSTLDTLDSIVPDAMVLGSVRSKNRLVAASTADDDTAVMTTSAKTTSLARDQGKESLLGGAPPTQGSSAVLTKNTMVARSDAATDSATMTKASGTLVRAEDPNAGDQKEAIADKAHLPARA